MNYLALCNSLKQKTGISGADLTTLTRLSGESARVASWINEAYLNIQMAESFWNWMRKPFTFATVSGQASYSPVQCGVTDLADWKMDSFRRYITSSGVRSEILMTQIAYDSYRDTYQFGNMRLVSGDPRFISRGPDRSLNIGMTPGDVGYTIVGEYYHAPVDLVATTDEPAMPAQYHMIVVYRAMVMYGMFEAASEVVQEGTGLYQTMLRRMLREQLPDITVGSALA